MNYQLSVDEVAMALSQIGEPEAARSLLEGEVGKQLSKETLQGRLLAAGHSLMARRLIQVDFDGTVHVDEDLKRALIPLARSEYSIRVSRVSDGPEETLSFHVLNGCIIEQSVERDIVYHLAIHHETQALIDGVASFLEVAPNTESDATGFLAPAILLDEFQETANPTQIAETLEGAGVPATLAVAFAEDFVGVQWRGAILRVEYPEIDGARSDRGLLVLRGSERAWLMRVEPGGDPATLSVFPLTASSLADEITALLA